MKQSNKCLQTLTKIAKEFPEQSILHHLSLILNEYNNIPLLTDKEFSYLLEKYHTERELDIPSQSPYIQETYDHEYDEDIYE